jgi:hypothetical protein
MGTDALLSPVDLSPLRDGNAGREQGNSAVVRV